MGHGAMSLIDGAIDGAPNQGPPTPGQDPRTPGQDPRPQVKAHGGPQVKEATRPLVKANELATEGAARTPGGPRGLDAIQWDIGRMGNF